MTIGDTVVHVSGAGLPLVFVHGFTTTAQFWREQIEAFSSRYRVIRIDLPGHGVSPRPEGRSYTIAAFANDILAVYRALEIDEAIPRRPLNGRNGWRRPLPCPTPSVSSRLCLSGQRPTDLARMSMSTMFSRPSMTSALSRRARMSSSVRSAVQPAETLSNLPDKRLPKRRLLLHWEAIASLNASDSRANLHDIGVPTLVVVGTEDIITPPGESVVLAEGIPESRLEVIADAGHFRCSSSRRSSTMSSRAFSRTAIVVFSVERHRPLASNRLSGRLTCLFKR
ncbi:alpha/beta fold hydrolase [Rhizobium beringeri]